mmetsp:Transcript_36344/g.82898  ORF Transcript_36344/g.82898 Transcript_36344/m.82898 type:complete len:321 (+) Transcript_36344:538-1500(+)
MPHVRDSSMRRLILLNKPTVLVLANEIGSDEARATVHLRDLVRQHVAVVVVRRHAEAATGPANDLHCGRIGNKMLELATATVQKAGSLELVLVVMLKHVLHSDPESLLPLEHSLLGHHVGDDLGVKAACEEVVCEVHNIVQGIVVCHHCAGIVVEDALIHNNVRAAITGLEGRGDLAPPDNLPASTILTTNSVTLKQHWLLEPQGHTLDVDCVSRDSDTIPSTAHCSIWTTPCLLQAQLLLLDFCGSHCGLFEDRPDAAARLHSFTQDSILGVITADTAQIIKLPGRNINVGLDPLLQHQAHGVTSHLLSSDVHHRWGFN